MYTGLPLRLLVTHDALPGNLHLEFVLLFHHLFTEVHTMTTSSARMLLRTVPQQRASVLWGMLLQQLLSELFTRLHMLTRSLVATAPLCRVTLRAALHCSRNSCVTLRNTCDIPVLRCACLNYIEMGRNLEHWTSSIAAVSYTHLTLPTKA